jgi:hypothetical protein
MCAKVVNGNAVRRICFDMRMKRLLLISTALLLSACGTVRIARINADPSHWANRTVRVEGRVTNSMGALGTGGYQVDDGTGKIYVLSSRGVPNKGASVKVTGRVISGVSFMGRSFGTAIREEHHKVRF